MSVLLLLPAPGGSVLPSHECVLLLFLSTLGGSILLPHECISPLILLMTAATCSLISSLVLPPVTAPASVGVPPPLPLYLPLHPQWQCIKKVSTEHGAR